MQGEPELLQRDAHGRRSELPRSSGLERGLGRRQIVLGHCAPVGPCARVRRRTVAGTTATSGDRERPPVGRRERRGGPGRASRALRLAPSTTARTAVPIEPPTRCTTVSCGVASAICSGRSTAYAALIAGMIAIPIPRPRSRSDASICHTAVSRADERQRDRRDRRQHDARRAPAARRRSGRRGARRTASRARRRGSGGRAAGPCARRSRRARSGSRAAAGSWRRTARRRGRTSSRRRPRRRGCRRGAR